MSRFTGSVAGAPRAGGGRANVVPVTLELGGKSPQLVFDDADLDAALPFLVNAGIQNAGQTCSASSRILVARGAARTSSWSGWPERYRALTRRAGGGRSRCRAADLGAAEGDRRGLSRGAIGAETEVAARGEIVGRTLRRAGTTWRPTPASAGSRPIMPAGAGGDLRTGSGRHSLRRRGGGGRHRQRHGIRPRGLGLERVTARGRCALRRRLHAGQVFVNNYGAGGGVELPFGGVGKSGHGREKGFEALYGFSQLLKTVAVWHGK
jgi:aldehyde dehydrogenase (NAD+)